MTLARMRRLEFWGGYTILINVVPELVDGMSKSLTLALLPRVRIGFLPLSDTRWLCASS